MNLCFQRSKISTAIKLEGGGLGLNGSAIKRRTFFCGFPNQERYEYIVRDRVWYNTIKRKSFKLAELYSYGIISFMIRRKICGENAPTDSKDIILSKQIQKKIF